MILLEEIVRYITKRRIHSVLTMVMYLQMQTDSVIMDLVVDMEMVFMEMIIMVMEASIHLVSDHIASIKLNYNII